MEWMNIKYEAWHFYIKSANFKLGLVFLAHKSCILFFVLSVHPNVISSSIVKDIFCFDKKSYEHKQSCLAKLE